MTSKKRYILIAKIPGLKDSKTFFKDEKKLTEAYVFASARTKGVEFEICVPKTSYIKYRERKPKRKQKKYNTFRPMAKEGQK